MLYLKPNKTVSRVGACELAATLLVIVTGGGVGVRVVGAVGALIDRLLAERGDDPQTCK